MTEQRTNDHHQQTNAWVAAAHTVASPSPSSDAAPAGEGVDATERPVFAAAHGGAGATVWSTILAGHDGGQISADPDLDTQGGSVVLVCRASADGIGAAKAAIAAHGSGTFAGVLVVAAGPGRTPRMIASELKVLSGALPIMTVPWMPGLLVKKASRITSADISAKDLTRISAGLREARVSQEGETS